MSEQPVPTGDLSWGSWSYAGGNGMRVGLQAYGGSGVVTGSTTWTMLWDIYTGNQYNYNDAQTLTWSSCAAGTLNYTNGQATGTSTMRKTVGCSHTYTTWGTSPGRLTINASVSGAYNGSTPSHTSYVDIPARPYATPNAPGSVVASRTSDTQAKVTWTDNPTAQRPITSFTIQMQTYTGSTWNTYTTVASPAASANTANITTAANRSYKFQMRSNNSVGSSSWVAGGQIYTTPAAPTSVTAAIINDDEVKVTWVNNAYTSGTVTHKIERSVNGGTWTSVKTGIAQATVTWTDTAPLAGENKYRVASTTSSGPLTSAWAVSPGVVIAYNDCWVWDGTQEIEAYVTVWNGTAEVQASLEIV